MVVDEEVVRLLLAELLERISPQDIAHKAVCRGFAEPVDLQGLAKHTYRALLATYALQIIECVKLGAKPSVYAQELLVHDGSEGQRTEGVHAGFIDGLGVLVLTLQLEGEVISQMTTFVVSSEQPKRIGVPNLQRPQVQNALQLSTFATWCRGRDLTSILK